jgi:hypothetical protein
MDDALISSIAKLNCAPGCFVEQSLPDLFGYIGLAVHHAAVADEDGLLVCIQRNLQEDILKDHLSFHKIDLKLDSVGKRHFLGLNKASSLHH